MTESSPVSPFTANHDETATSSDASEQGSQVKRSFSGSLGRQGSSGFLDGKPRRRDSYVKAEDRNPQLKQEQVDEYRAVFDIFDTDKSGEVCARRPTKREAASRLLPPLFDAGFPALRSSSQIDASELFQIFTQLGMNPSMPDVERMVRNVDVDGSGSIGFTEFLKLMRNEVRAARAHAGARGPPPRSSAARSSLRAAASRVADRISDPARAACVLVSQNARRAPRRRASRRRGGRTTRRS